MSKVNNFNSLQGQRHLSQTQREQQKSTQKLATGKRINSASDDAAALGISKKLNATAKSKSQAMRNATDAISIVQTIEGGLHDFANIISRMRELAIQASSGHYATEERAIIDKEVQQNLIQIDQLAHKQEMFGQKIAVGQSRKLDIQVDVGNGASDKIQIDLENLSHTTAALGINDIDVKTTRHAQLSLLNLDFALREVSTSMARMGALSSRLEKAVEKLNGDIVNTKQANSRIEDTDYAQSTAENVKQTILKEGQTSVLAQTNNSQRRNLKLFED